MSITVEAGEFVAIVGSSGSGKSTLLNILGLLDTASSGAVVIDGVDASSLTPDALDTLRGRTFGFVFQSSNVLPEETVERNAALALRTQGWQVERQTEAVAKALDSLHLSHRIGATSKNLSGGERQRLAIARAISAGPSVVLADEPTGNLDTTNGRNVLGELRRINQGGATVIIVTHDEHVAAATDRIIRVSDGLIAADERSSGAAGDPAPSIPGPAPKAVRRKRRYLASEALASITSRPLRALLLVFAFFLGSGGLVMAVGLSESASQQVAERLAASAYDEVRVSLPPQLISKESRQLIARLDGVQGVGDLTDIAASDADIWQLPQEASVDGVRFDGPVLGADAELVALFDARTEPVNAPSLLDFESGRPMALIGVDAAKALGVSTGSPGEQIWVAGTAVDVVGIITDSSRRPELKGSIVLPSVLAQSVPNARSSLVIRTERGYSAPVAEAVPLALDPGNPASIDVSTVADLRSLTRGVSSDLGILVGFTAAIVLVLAMLMAGTASYLSVQARAAEIALRRAVGASRSSIMRLFVYEGAFLGAGGGLAGVSIGLLALVLACLALGWSPALSPIAIGVGLLSGVSGGVLSALIPAYIAARTDPATAIRG